MAEPLTLDAIAAELAALPDAVLTTSFGIEDQLLTAVAAPLGVRIVTLDTGRLFAETHQLWAETERRYGIAITAIAPAPDDLARVVATYGANGFYDSRAAREACCAARKVRPLARALAGSSHWITGLRADQSAARADVRVREWDEQYRLWKHAPLADWTRAMVVTACAAHDVPVNALHARGYASIGCAPCTRAIAAHEDERAGRWWWERGDAECGLHVDASGKLVRAS